MTASATASANQAYQATLSSQVSRTKKNDSPKTSPQQNDARKPRPASASTSRAGPATASGHTLNGGNASARATPPASETSSAQRVRSPVDAESARVPGSAAAAWADITVAA